MIPATMKQPSVFVPPAMSLAALAVVVGHAAIFGITPPPGSTPLTRIFQLLMAAQLPVVLFLAVTRLGPRCRPRASLLCRPPLHWRHSPLISFSPSSPPRLARRLRGCWYRVSLDPR
jgi:hypothetical protein